MRTYHKGWQNKRPDWTRRVKWYQGSVGESISIRLQFEEYPQGGGGGRWNRFYSLVEDATVDYEAFIEGALPLFGGKGS